MIKKEHCGVSCHGTYALKRNNAYQVQLKLRRNFRPHRALDEPDILRYVQNV